MLGGISLERNVSVETGLAIGNALKTKGHDIAFVDTSFPPSENNNLHNELRKNDITVENFRENTALREEHLLSQVLWIKENRFNIVFNALHGAYGENGSVSALLELEGIPYTGSGLSASALAMDKYRSKMIFETNSISTAKYEIVKTAIHKPRKLSFPLVIKPNRAGSSVGLYILKEEQDIFKIIEKVLVYDNEILIEEYIDGIELTVPIIKGEAYPVVEIVPTGGIYDYKRKYTAGSSQYFSPARIEDKKAGELQQLALKIYHILGLENYGRIDFRMDHSGTPYCLEANTLPGMTSTSLVPKSAAAKGIEFPDLLEIIIHDALTIKRRES